jgi:hypothetical protein
MAVEISPYDPAIDHLTFLFNKPVDSPQNPALQQEMDKAQALFKERIQHCLENTKSLREFHQEQKQRLRQGLEIADSPLQDLVDQEVEDISHILDFIEKLKKQAAVPSNEIQAFWSWAKDRFSLLSAAV